MVMRIIKEELSLHLQSSNRVHVLSQCRKETSRAYPWMRCVLPKGYVGCPQATQPLSFIIEMSMHPIFDLCEKGTLKVYP